MPRPTPPRWRLARPEDDPELVALCLALNREDPGPAPIPPAQVRRTLRKLRAEPLRGRAVVLERDGRVEGYALLLPLWSNELGGEVCFVDELYLVPAARGHGLGRRLMELIVRGRGIWPRRPAALAVEVTPANRRARAFYERLGFERTNLAMVLRVRPPRARVRRGSRQTW
jgi:GNAT superfamily N-acetyltransferase